MNKEDAQALLDVARLQTVYRPPPIDRGKLVRLLIAIIASLPRIRPARSRPPS